MNGWPWLLADDLTGGLEAGAAWRKAGWRVFVPLDAERVVDPPSAGTLVVLSTETRNASDRDAAESVERAMRRVASLGGRLVGKKIDSTLRGPVAAELKVLAAEAKPPLIVVAPTHPAAGRCVERGCLLVNGEPVAETPIGRDPRAPVIESDLLRLLQAETWARTEIVPATAWRDANRSAEVFTELRSRGIDLVVADASTTEHLTALAAGLRLAVPGAVLVGSAPALAQRVEPSSKSPGERCGGIKLGPAVLFAIGSRHPVSIAQADRLRQEGGLPSWPSSSASAGAAVPVKAVCEPGRGSHAAPEEILARTAEAVRRWLVHHPQGTIVATGGETARAVAEALEGQAFEVLGEFDDGVVAAQLDCRWGHAVRFVMKPGGFGEEEIWIKMLSTFP